MKALAGLILVLAILAPAAGPAAAASLDRYGTWIPEVSYTQTQNPDTRALISDGSFEQGPPPASAWTEVSNDPTCEWIGDFSSAWYVSSWDGYFDYWAGGYCYDQVTGLYLSATSSVSQTLLVPAGGTNLSFYYVSFRPDLDDDPVDGDRVYVAINGAEIWSMDMTQANNSYPSWVGPVLVDVSAYAGQSVTLTFGGSSFGDVTGNVRFDFIEFVEGPTPVQVSGWGTIKALYR